MRKDVAGRVLRCVGIVGLLGLLASGCSSGNDESGAGSDSGASELGAESSDDPDTTTTAGDDDDDGEAFPGTYELSFGDARIALECSATECSLPAGITGVPPSAGVDVLEFPVEGDSQVVGTVDGRDSVGCDYTATLDLTIDASGSVTGTGSSARACGGSLPAAPDLAITGQRA